MTVSNVNPEFEQLHRSMEQYRTPLHEELRLDLADHKLTDPESNRGEVISIQEAECLYDGTKTIEVYDVQVKDPFVDADPRGYEITRQYISHIEEVMQEKGFDPLAERSEATNSDEWNEYTAAWLADETVSGLALWRDNVPSALALGYLTNPWVGSEVTTKNGKESDIISPETATQLRFVDDAVAIRDRAAAMEEIVKTAIHAKHKSGDEISWLSLASGTAEPSIQAAKSAEEDDGVLVELTVTDYDGRALKFVSSNAERIGFDGQTNTVKVNILSPDLKEKLTEKGVKEQYDVVENMGFEEYLPQEGDELGAFKGNGLPQASDFTRNAWDLVKPGGVLISGNMVLDRPQIGFVFGVVDWPLINARSEQSILRVYKEAGILDDPTAKVEMFRVKNVQTGGHVYNIVQVSKADQ